MILEKGDMWSIFEKTDFFFFTANSFLNIRNELVMGRGMALEVKKKFPKVPSGFRGQIEHLGYYGLAIALIGLPSTSIGAFQVKYHFKNKAELALIHQSTGKLERYASIEFPECRFDLNFPGIGYGGLKYKDVLPIIQKLPDNVHVWTR